MTIANLRPLLISWLNGTIPAILADQNAPQPPLPYATVKLIAAPVEVVVSTHSYDESADLGQEISLEQNIVKLATFSVQVFAATPGDAFALLSSASNRLRLQSTLAPFQQANCALQAVGAVRDISTLAAGLIQSRAQVELAFQVVETVEEKTGYISTYDAEGTYN